MNRVKRNTLEESQGVYGYHSYQYQGLNPEEDGAKTELKAFEVERDYLYGNHTTVRLNEAPVKGFIRRNALYIVIAVIGLLVLCIGFQFSANRKEDPIIFKAAWSSIAEPFSTVNPLDLSGILIANRPDVSKPGAILKELSRPLPTNSWSENFFLGPEPNTLENNHVFELPYIIDTGGIIPGVRTHGAHVQANDRAVMMTYEPYNGLSLGAVEEFLPQHIVSGEFPSVARLAVVLQWNSEEREKYNTGPSMRSPIVRGAPYTTMEYLSSTPRIVVQRHLKGNPLVDQKHKMPCSYGVGVFDSKPVLVEKEIKIQFFTSDMTWLIFVSEPTEFVCTTINATVGARCCVL